jgi:hypothetical protein
MTDARTLDPLVSPRPVVDAPVAAPSDTATKESQKLSPKDETSDQAEKRKRRLPFRALKLPIDGKTQVWMSVGLLLVLAAAVYMAWGFIAPMN